MITRLKNIIEREKVKAPHVPGFFLLVNGLWKGVRSRLDHYLMNFRKDSTFTSPADLFMCSLFPKKILDAVIERIKPASVLDVGCGTGGSLAYFLENGIKAQGLENSAIAIQQSPVKAHIIKYNLNKTYKSDQHYDLVWCFEVIEHIHPDFEAGFLKTLVNHSDTVVLSAARPGQGGHGHFNEQEPEYWIKKFDALGFDLDDQLTTVLRQTGETHAANMLCFRKRRQ